MKVVLWGSLGAMLAVIAGCTAPSADGLREFDLRKPSHQYVDSHIYMDFSTVQRQLYIHREACDVEVELRLDPMQVHFATVLYGPAGAQDLKNQVMLDLTAYATGKLQIEGYSYYAANKFLVRDLVQVLDNPTSCPEGISSNPSPNPYVNMSPSTEDSSAKKE